MDASTLTQLTRLLVGQVCTSIEYQGGLPNIVFGMCGLFVWSAWRVIHEGNIVAGSDSEDMIKEELKKLLVGRTVQSVTVSNPLHDLQLKLDSAVLIETFGSTEKYEHWQVAKGPNDMVVAGPGQLWSSFGVRI